MSSEPLNYIKINPGNVNTSLLIPTSKSHANRLLILAAVKNGPVEIKGLPDSTDVLTMISSLKTVGLDIIEDNEKFVIKDSFPECEKGQGIIKIETGDGGTTNRFLMPFLSRGKNEYEMIMGKPMRTRPMGELIRPLRELGVKVEKTDEGFIVQGPFKQSVKVTVESEKSTQFISGVLLATFDHNDVQSKPDRISSSEKYYEMTLDLIKEIESGVNEFIVPADSSSLGYAIAAGVTLNSVKIKNCHSIDHYQADSEIFNILKLIGANYSFTDGLNVEKCENIRPFDIDCSGFPDLVPTLAYISSCSPGKSVLRNLEVLTHKECDRFEEIMKLLKLFNVEFNKNGYDLEITGRENTISTQVTYDPPDDHRMIMTAYLFMKRNGGGRISNYHHVKKSFPDFFKVMDKCI
ncbi:MAG: hypothetical protein KC493_02535 [Bacteriovoracaceae bacterium]|nr:hypothetical protein [Bacteriovoracaceae bacterium]